MEDEYIWCVNYTMSEIDQDTESEAMPIHHSEV